MPFTNTKRRSSARGNAPWYAPTASQEAILFGAVQLLMLACVVLVGAQLVLNP